MFCAQTRGLPNTNINNKYFVYIKCLSSEALRGYINLYAKGKRETKGSPPFPARFFIYIKMERRLYPQFMHVPPCVDLSPHLYNRLLNHLPSSIPHLPGNPQWPPCWSRISGLVKKVDRLAGGMWGEKEKGRDTSSPAVPWRLDKQGNTVWGALSVLHCPRAAMPRGGQGRSEIGAELPGTQSCREALASLSSLTKFGHRSHSLCYVGLAGGRGLSNSTPN